jgi:hypothetical protein
MPNNFNKLFAFAQLNCNCHHLRLTMPNLLWHAGVDSEAWMNQILQPEKPNARKNSTYWRRQNERSVRRFVNLA